MERQVAFISRRVLMQRYYFHGERQDGGGGGRGGTPPILPGGELVCSAGEGLLFCDPLMVHQFSEKKNL